MEMCQEDLGRLTPNYTLQGLATLSVRASISEFLAELLDCAVSTPSPKNSSWPWTMPQEASNDASTHSQSSGIDAPTARVKSRNFLRIPPVIKRVFNRFPLITYPPNELNLCAPKAQTKHALYIFQARDSTLGNLSCNPSCLKWQVGCFSSKDPAACQS